MKKSASWRFEESVCGSFEGEAAPIAHISGAAKPTLCCNGRNTLVQLKIPLLYSRTCTIEWQKSAYEGTLVKPKALLYNYKEAPNMEM